MMVLYLFLCWSFCGEMTKRKEFGELLGKMENQGEEEISVRSAFGFLLHFLQVGIFQKDKNPVFTQL